MGYVKVRGKVCNAEQPSRCQEVEFLADTGAIYSVVPQAVLQKLGIKEIGRQRFKLANGSIIERDYGVMLIERGDQVGATRVIFGKEGDTPVMGVTTLEELGLKINPVTGELEPLELLLL